jgi:MSHA biogenesis protein MshJ
MSALAKKYESLSLRERAFVVLALLALVIHVWDTVLMDPLRRARAGLEAELASASASGVNATSDDVSDPRQQSIKRAGELQTRLATLDAQLKSTARGFVSADRMIEVLHDVLDRQGRLELVSIRNLPVSSLVPPDAADPAAGVAAASGAPGTAELQPPYVHSIELIVEGQYSDVLDYLGQLEALPWKFRWTSLDLSTAGYPRNRVRIELSTLSLDSTWLGV